MVGADVLLSTIARNAFLRKKKLRRLFSVSSDLRSHRGQRKAPRSKDMLRPASRSSRRDQSKQMTCLTAQPISSDADRPQPRKKFP